MFVVNNLLVEFFFCRFDEYFHSVVLHKSANPSRSFGKLNWIRKQSYKFFHHQPVNFDGQFSFHPIPMAIRNPNSTPRRQPKDLDTYLDRIFPFFFGSRRRDCSLD